MSFRGAIYHFPITLWFPLKYPREAPIAYVTPPPPRPQDNAPVVTVIRPGQHVSVEGKIYHPFLAAWSEGSSIADLLAILRDIFSKEPPVVSRPASQPPLPPPPPPSQSRSEPPPVPPLPPDLVRNDFSRQSLAAGPPQPPPKPPKQASDQSVPSSNPSPFQQQTPSPLRQPQGPPPLPPLPSELRTQYTPTLPGPPLHSPVVSSPLSQQHSGPQYGPPRPPIPGYPNGQSQPQLQQPLPIHPPAPTQLNVPPTPVSATAPAAPKQPPKDLLTDPFDMESISTQNAAQVTPPPIPLNPQKDALLRTLSETLTKQLQSNVAQNNSGLELLASQADAMRAASLALVDEITRVSQLRSTISNNIEILKEGLNKADEVIRDTTGMGPNGVPSSEPRPLPSIDETLVPPTVVHKQLHDLIISERAIQRSIYALQEALTKGRVGVDVWAKVTRGLAREAFLKRALAMKAAQGAGLDLD